MLHLTMLNHNEIVLTRLEVGKWRPGMVLLNKSRHLPRPTVTKLN
jgi:hypothetical protein